ncbi:MAG: CHAP domain-containing protein [Ruminococcaceae bacterium]|nr:CHAP domain-containing protein [Oscillospiraceae bacterium]
MRAVANRLIAVLLAGILAAGMLNVSALAAGKNSYRSASIVSVALGELGYSERENSNYSKYGVWYGCSNAYWCDMFVSWCASKAGYPKSFFPRNKSCTLHMQSFARMGEYYPSQSRGGDYTPRQGDLIFFYDADKHPKGDVLLHVGIVLFVEGDIVCTIEGNTRTTRQDYDYCSVILPLREVEPESITDYVAVKQYRLSERCIHGYAAPNYGDRTVLELGSYVDMAEFPDDLPGVEALVDAGIMSKTSAFTFSPKYGMTRGEFVKSIMTLYELSGYEDGTAQYADVPEAADYYDALLTAKSLGVIGACEDELFEPEKYISSQDAQEIISNTLACLGRPDLTFSFPDGDMSYLLTQYTNRIDIARALSQLLAELASPTESSAQMTVDGASVACPLLMIDGVNYVATDEARRCLASEADVWACPGTAPELHAAERNATRVFVNTAQVLVGEKEKAVSYFVYGGAEYVKLRDCAALNGFQVFWDADANTVCLTSEAAE